jgi:proteasome accessory factor C
VTRESTADKVARLLVMAPWIASQPGGVSIAEVCERFVTTPTQLTADLGALGMVGIAPHSPDMYVEVTLSDDWVVIKPQWFDRPPALLAAQGLALLAAAEGLAEIDGVDPQGPLARALAKVEKSLGVEVGRLKVDLGHADDAVMEAVRRAVADQTSLDISYYSHGVNKISERTIEPWRLFSADGYWYTDAWCHTAGDVRLFRLDRISSASSTSTAATVERQDLPDHGPDLYKPGADDVAVSLLISPEMAWATERWNTESVVTRPDGYLEVELSVGSTAWLERVLVQLGDRATVISSTDEAATDRSAVARRILERYRS